MCNTQKFFVTPLAVVVISTGCEGNFHTYEEIQYSVTF